MICEFSLLNYILLRPIWTSLMAQTVKCLPTDAGDLGSIPGLGRSPGEGNGNPLQYSCLENPMDGGAWWATVHGVSKSQDTTERLHFQTHLLPISSVHCEHSPSDSRGRLQQSWSGASLLGAQEETGRWNRELLEWQGMLLFPLSSGGFLPVY